MKIKDMNNKELEIFVRKRLNQKEILDENGNILSTAKGFTQEHDRFNMSGYGNNGESATYHNIEILERFVDLGLFPSDSNRQGIGGGLAWKGNFEILLSYGEKIDFSSSGTVDIIMTLLNRFCQDAEVGEEFLEYLPTKYTAKTIKQYIRRKALAEKLKEECNGLCQLCSSTFQKKDEKNYSEVHHIIPLSENGFDSKENILILCPTCHKKLHYANVDLTKFSKERKIIINNEEIKVR